MRGDIIAWGEKFKLRLGRSPLDIRPVMDVCLPHGQHVAYPKYEPGLTRWADISRRRSSERNATSRIMSLLLRLPRSIGFSILHATAIGHVTYETASAPYAQSSPVVEHVVHG